MKQFIDKATIVAEIKRLIQANELYLSEPKIDEIRFQKAGAYSVLNDLLHFLNTLEVKEVDFERDLSKYVSNGIHRFFPNEDDDYCKMDSIIWQDYVIETAEHFFELGIKTKRE